MLFNHDAVVDTDSPVATWNKGSIASVSITKTPANTLQEDETKDLCDNGNFQIVVDATLKSGAPAKTYTDTVTLTVKAI